MSTVARYQEGLDLKHGPDFIIESDICLAEVQGEQAILMPVDSLKQLYISALSAYENPKNPEHELEQKMFLKAVHALAANAGLRINQVKIKAEECSNCKKSL